MKPIYLVIICTGVAVAAFFGGMEYQKKQSPQFPGRQNGQFMMRTQNNGQSGQRTQGFRPINGEIIKQDETSITVKLQDGSSKIVMLSESTTVSKAELGSESDLKIGEKIAAFGKENTDGSITAQSIQLNPQERMMFGQSQGSPAAAPQQ